MEHNPDKLLSIGEAAEAMGVSRSTMNRLLRRGGLGYVRLPGGDPRVPLSAIKEWITKNLVRAAAQNDKGGK